MGLRLFLFCLLLFIVNPSFAKSKAREYTFNRVTKNRVLQHNNSKESVQRVLSNSQDNSYIGLLTEVSSGGYYQLTLIDYKERVYFYQEIKWAEIVDPSFSIALKAKYFSPLQGEIDNEYSVTSKGVFDTVIDSKTYKALKVKNSSSSKSPASSFVIDTSYQEMPILKEEFFGSSPKLFHAFPKGRIIASSLRDKNYNLLWSTNLLGIRKINLRIRVTD